MAPDLDQADAAQGNRAAGEPDGGHRLSALDHLLKRTAAQEPPKALRWSRPSRVSVTVAMAIGIAVVGSIASWSAWHFLARPAPIEQRMPVASETDVVAEGQPGGTPREEPETVPPEALVVHVAGAVVAPGLVEIGAGSRVADAVAAAGGVAAQADHARLNLAAPVVDGARVYVPAVGEQVPAELTFQAPAPGGAGTGGAGSTAPVDVNTADSAGLETLPGVGPATASAIIEYREKNGPFESPEDLLGVRGIGEAKLEAITEHIAVG